uniref:Uncharacterized protein n=1 Tax=Arundo donax TaxID=35708 RepID=A0A0A9H614_ARUDO
MQPKVARTRQARRESTCTLRSYAYTVLIRTWLAQWSGAVVHGRLLLCVAWLG